MENLRKINLILLLVGTCIFAGCSSNIHSAAGNGNIAKIQEFMNQGVDVNLKSNDKHQMTPLLNAALQGENEAVAFLLDNGADIEAREKSSNATAVLLLSVSDYSDTLDLLLKRGANVHARTGTSTPLSMAAAENKLENVKILIAHGANKRDISKMALVGMKHMKAAGKIDFDDELLRILTKLLSSR